MGKKVGEEDGKGNGTGCFVLRLLSLFLQARILGEDFSRILISSPCVPFRVMVSIDWLMAGQGVFSHCSGSWPHPPGFAALFGRELKGN